MEARLRDYIENLFAYAPATKQASELKEEIIKNTIERYHDLLNEGKNETEAYNLAIAGIGDINELLEALGAQPITEQTYSDEQLAVIGSRSSVFKSIAIALYILCVTPCIIFGQTPFPAVGPALMFFMISIATGLLIYGKITKYMPVMDSLQAAKSRKKGILRAVSVGMYISCVTPCILLSEAGSLVTVSPVIMFAVIAAATVLIILSNTDKSYTKTDETMVENFKEWNSRKKQTSALYKALVAVLWVTASFVYIWLTFATGFTTVVISWIVFLIAAALQNMMKAIFDYTEASV